MMQTHALAAQIRATVRQLQGFHGFRTLWIDRGGQLCHSEPDEELERSGYIYVTTVLRPAEDDVMEAVRRVLQVAA